MRKSIIELGMPKALYFGSSFIRLDKLVQNGMKEQIMKELKTKNIDAWFLELIDFELLSDYASKFRTLRDFLDSDEGYDIVSNLLKLGLGTEKTLNGKIVGKQLNHIRKGQRKSKCPVKI